MAGYPRRASLAGRCGIPSERERVYVHVDLAQESLSPTDRGFRPARIVWPDGRYWHIESIYSKRTYGRSFLGNLCIRWTVCIRHRQKEIWWEHGDWFVKVRSGIAAKPPSGSQA